MSKRKAQGFTLIELMVVVAIIGIITAVLFASFDEGRKQSRDKVRMAELKELQLAIELYKAQNGVYPASLNALTPDFVSQIPADPTGGSYSYSTFSSATSYKLLNSNVETLYISSFSDEFARCPSASANCPSVAAIQSTYAVYSAGAETQ